MDAKNSVIPQFGPLSGVRVLSIGSIVAGPNTANLLADFGAEVVHVERPEVGDTLRALPPFAKNEGKSVSTTWAQDARNRLSLTMEFSLDVPEGKELFMDLVKSSDILIENLVWLEKLGIHNEEMMAANPKLIICHISGFGRPQFGGDPEICDRASYDMIGQAYGGYAYINGDPEPAAPAIVKPWFNDYLSSYVAAFGILSAYIHAQNAGKGQEVDVAQFEACAKLLADTVVTYSTTGVVKKRSGPDSPAFQPYGLFRDAQGEYLVIGAYGPGVYKRAIQAFGLDTNYFSFAEAGASPQAMQSQKGKELKDSINQWCAKRTAVEIVNHMAKFKVPASKVNSVKDIIADPHWLGRGDIVTYKDESLGKDVQAVGIIPKLSDTPGKVWRGAPVLGQDTDDILTKVLGYSAEKIQALKDRKLI